MFTVGSVFQGRSGSDLAVDKKVSEPSCLPPRAGVFEAFFALMCSKSCSPNRRLECPTVCWPNLRAFPLGSIRIKLASPDFDAQGVDRTFVPSPWFGFFSRANGLKEPTPDTHPIRKKQCFQHTHSSKPRGVITPGRVRSDPASPPPKPSPYKLNSQKRLRPKTTSIALKRAFRHPRSFLFRFCDTVSSYTVYFVSLS